MIKKTILENGLIIITEENNSVPSFSMSCTLKSGSRAETKEVNGIHHLIEHMIFKGTEKYDMVDIANISDRLGGRLNAFTGKEITQFYLKAIDEKFDIAFDLLTDMVFNSVFDEQEFEKERNVVLQEIKESEDSPDTNAFELFYENIFKENPIGFPVAGKMDIVSKFTRDLLYDYYKDKYRPSNLLLSVVGNINHERVVEKANAFFKKYGKDEPKDFKFGLPEFNRFTLKHKKDSLKQLYVIIGLQGVSAVSEDRYKFMVLNDVLGAGMSSRLFQKIREEKGLAYTINSFPDSFLDVGIYIVFSIIDPKDYNAYINEVKNILYDVKNRGVSQEELERAKDHIKSSIILGLENNLSRMRNIVNRELYNKEILDVNKILYLVNNYTKEEIDRIASTYFDVESMSVFSYGKTD